MLVRFTLNQDDGAVDFLAIKTSQGLIRQVSLVPIC